MDFGSIAGIAGQGMAGFSQGGQQGANAPRPQPPQSAQFNPAAAAQGNAAGVAAYQATRNANLLSAIQNLNAANQLAAARPGVPQQASVAQRAQSNDMRQLQNQVHQDTLAQQQYDQSPQANPNYMAADAALRQMSPQAQQIGDQTEAYVNGNAYVPQNLFQATQGLRYG